MGSRSIRAVKVAAASAAAGAAGFAAAATLPGTAAAHLSGCHSHHTCPSDHHTYVWIDPATGGGWDCAEPGAPEYDPARDTTTIVYDGYTYYCRSVAAAPPGTTTAPPPPVTTTPPATTTQPVATTTSTGTTSRTTPTATPLAPRTKSAACVSRNALPDAGCTPGAVFPDVTAATVCVSGYAASVRDVSSSLKRRVYAEYGIHSHRRGAYEVDHLVSLELGGSNAISNLWPERADPRPGFHEKDRVENYLHDQVCRGTMTLALAQSLIAHDWIAVYAKLQH